MIVDYEAGTALRARLRFRDALTGSLVDPDNLLVRVRAGSNATVTYTYGSDPTGSLTKVSTGTYDLIYTVPVGGKIVMRVVTTGSRPTSSTAQLSGYDPNL